MIACEECGTLYTSLLAAAECGDIDRHEQRQRKHPTPPKK